MTQWAGLACSPLRRARQTADIVGRRLGLPVVMELDELREVNVGDLDGRSDARAWEIYAAVLAAWRAGDNRARFPGGENCDELCARLRRALTAVARGAVGEGRSLLVAHGASLRAAVPGLTAGPILEWTCRPAGWPRSASASAASRWNW